MEKNRYYLSLGTRFKSAINDLDRNKTYLQEIRKHSFIIHKMALPKYFRNYLGFGLGAALAYSCTVFYFIQQAQYADTWVLYVGNFLFMAVVVWFLFYISGRMEIRTKTLSLIKAASLTTVIGVIFSCLLSVILLLFMVHGLLGKGVTDKVMTGKPVNTIHDRTNGLDFMVIINSIIGNFLTGAFVSIIFSPSLYRTKKLKDRSLSD